MLKQFRNTVSNTVKNTDSQSDATEVVLAEFVQGNRSAVVLLSLISASVKDYFKFVFYCTLLIVPLYAITVSILKQNWIMVLVDVLLVPVGFVHGLVLLLGYLN